MDSYNSTWPDRDNDGIDDYDSEPVDLTPPPAIGQDERRMQVRAYNHWASLLGDRKFPAIDDLEPEELHDFGPNSVLLDFSVGQEDPAITYLGDKLAWECGDKHPIRKLSDVPGRSLLSRITDHYLQIIANEAPIGFEAEFVNHSGHTILYRGILLPYSSDDDTIDFIYGVINWKEMADQQTSDELLLELDNALSADSGIKAARHEAPMGEWADGPTDSPLEDDVLELGADEPALHSPLAALAAGLAAARQSGGEPADEYQDDADVYEAKDLHGLLASARELAEVARGADDRSRQALYAAIGRAYDFALAAYAAPEDYAHMVANAGLTVQPRAPMTPVVKLVFGVDYDKTRLTEYASALAHAKRIELPQGALADYIETMPGGLKALVQSERDLRRPAGKTATVRNAPRPGLARKLRKINHRPLDSLDPEGSEFTLLVARRMETGTIVLLGEISDDVATLERMAKRLV